MENETTTSELVNAEGVTSIQMLASTVDALSEQVKGLDKAHSNQLLGLQRQIEGLREQLRSLEKNTQRDMEATRSLVDAASKLALEAQKTALAAGTSSIVAKLVEQRIGQVERRLENYNANHKKLGYGGLIE